jgi:hypothetical protein
MPDRIDDHGFMRTCHCSAKALWEGFKNRDKSEDLPDTTKRSKLSGRKALDH